MRCDMRSFPFLKCAYFSWRPARPPFVGVGEGTWFAIAKQPCNFGNGQIPILQVALGKTRSQPVEHGGESEPLIGEPTHECARAHAEPPSDFGCTRLSMRQERRNRILYVDTECTSGRPM